MKNNDNLKSQIESILLVAGKPLGLKEIALAVGRAMADVEIEIKKIMSDYQERGIKIIKKGENFLLTTSPENAEIVSRFLNEELRHELSASALETLAIVVYKQPVTKAEIEEIRGTDSQKPLRTLLLRGLIEERGRKEAPGRPILYGSSMELLSYLGLKNEEEIPKIEEFTLSSN